MIRTYLIAALCLAAGCSKAVTIRGERAFTVAGTPPTPTNDPEARVEVRDNRIEIREKVQFEYNKATILPVSHSLLDEVVRVIQSNPHLLRIRIEGHASAEGSARHNQKLSEARAQAVMQYLVDKGVAKERLSSAGYGSSQPIADNASEAGREQNRRVELEILEQTVTTKTVQIDARGAEKVVDEKTSTVSTPATATSQN